MTEDEFIKAAARTRMNPRTVNAAKLVLIDGLRIVEAARQTGMKRQQIGVAVRKIKEQLFPAEWVRISVCVPPDCVSVILAIEAEARRNAGLATTTPDPSWHDPTGPDPQASTIRLDST